MLRYLRNRITRAKVSSVPQAAARNLGGSVSRPWSMGFLSLAKFASNLSCICQQAFGYRTACQTNPYFFLAFASGIPAQGPIATSVRPRQRRAACMHSFSIEFARRPPKDCADRLGRIRQRLLRQSCEDLQNRRGQWRRPCVESTFSSDTLRGFSPLAGLYIQNEGLSETF